jgi:gliding motility-associated lipoprotein GldH
MLVNDKQQFFKGRIAVFMFFGLLLMGLVSCDKTRVFEDNQEIEKGAWDQNKKMIFSIPVDDTLSWHNIYINVRNSGSYPFSNLFLFVNTQSPKGIIESDTVECKLADESGKWLGDGIGDLYDNQILFKRFVRFPVKGIYKIQLEQAMRINPLPALVDIGIRVEKTNFEPAKGALLKNKK